MATQTAGGGGGVWGRVVSIGLAPARALERTRGWKRLALLAAYLVVGGMMAGGLAWQGQLRGLPDLGDPPEVARQRAERVPDDRNAYVLYRRAIAAGNLYPDPASAHDEATSTPVIDWSKADQALKDWAASNRQALAIWRQGTDRTDASPRDAGLTGQNDRLLDDLRRLIQLAALEGSRLRDEGDLAGAWAWYRACLRCGRHIARRGGPWCSIYANQYPALAMPGMTAWLEDPRVDAPLLRRALADLQDCRRMTDSIEEAFAHGYMEQSDLLESEAWDLVEQAERQRLQQLGRDAAELEGWFKPWCRLRYTARREVERCRRIMAIVGMNGFEGRRGQAAGGPPPNAGSGNEIMLYPGAGPLPDEAIREAVASSDLAAFLVAPEQPDRIIAMLKTDRSALDSLTIRFAERLYFVEKGRETEAPGDLVPEYLESLPEGY